MSSKSKNTDLSTYKNFAEVTLKSSGKIALKYFRGNNKPNLKKDKTIVTLADTEIETFTRKQITRNFPGHEIWGEEFGYSGNSNFTWVIDPIDGTSSFAAGRPIWGIMLGLLIDGYPALGAVYQPFTEELWMGVTEFKKSGNTKYKTYYNNKLLKLSNSQLSKFSTPKILATTSPALLDEKGKKIFEKLSKNHDTTIYGGDCYNYCLMANGNIYTIFEQGLKPHDYIPLLPILWGAGVKVTDENGKEIRDFSTNQSLLATRVI